jgi:hypothetical protein
MIYQVAPPKSYHELLHALGQGQGADADAARHLLASFKVVVSTKSLEYLILDC